MQYSYWQVLIVSFIIVSFQQWFTVPFQSDLRIDIEIFLVSQGELWAGTIRGFQMIAWINYSEIEFQIFQNDILMKTTFRFAQLFTRTGCPGPSTPSDFLSPISSFLLRSAHNIFFWLLSFTFEWRYHRNSDLKDAFFTDSRGDERVHMPFGLVKLVHFTQTEPEQFYQPDCARGQCKNQCLCVQLTLLIVHLYLYLYLYYVTWAPLLYFIRLNCYCWGNSSIPEGRFSKWF